ncbi:hypothetical protein [Bradyrhizobium sp.]|uniref:hypothetical protein n=1 Tax=Bradyrhizobium sp. TaxID=376 RepID=UPI0027363E4D|nr:hypothetical protein [Bradyrhizobium sp.]MDP3074740.1 hypothetical protein [Bradyrhizobium sp.]
MAWYRRHYTCPCGISWWDEWSCLCNDRCPKCNREIEPDDHEVVEAEVREIEYEFTLPDGTKRYEFVDPDAGYSVMTQVGMFMAMHGAIIALPVKDKPND